MLIEMLDHWYGQSQVSLRSRHIGPCEGLHNPANCGQVLKSTTAVRIEVGIRARSESQRRASSLGSADVPWKEKKWTLYLWLQNHCLQKHQGLMLECMDKLTQTQSKQLISFILVIYIVFDHALLEVLRDSSDTVEMTRPDFTDLPAESPCL